MRLRLLCRGISKQTKPAGGRPQIKNQTNYEKAYLCRLVPLFVRGGVDGANFARIEYDGSQDERLYYDERREGDGDEEWDEYAVDEGHDPETRRDGHDGWDGEEEGWYDLYAERGRVG